MKTARQVLDRSVSEDELLDYMCPNCVTPWKCNGPHIPDPSEPVSCILSVSLAGFPPPPNTTRRRDYHANSDEAAVWRNAAKLMAMQALREHPYPQDFPLRKATIEVVAIGVKVDPDGCVSAIKPCLDGLVDAGVLVDDSWRTLDGLRVTWEAGPRGLRLDVLFGRPA